MPLSRYVLLELSVPFQCNMLLTIMIWICFFVNHSCLITLYGFFACRLHAGLPHKQMHHCFTAYPNCYCSLVGGCGVVSLILVNLHVALLLSLAVMIRSDLTDHCLWPGVSSDLTRGSLTVPWSAEIGARPANCVSLMVAEWNNHRTPPTLRCHLRLACNY